MNSLHPHTARSKAPGFIQKALILGAGAAALMAVSDASAQSYTIDWGTIGWVSNTAANGTDTSLVGGPTSAHYGLASSTGGVTGFSSQSFANYAGSGVDLTVHYSQNGYDNNPNEGPDRYSSTNGSFNENPDSRVTGRETLRINSDLGTSGSPTTPFTIVFSFSRPVYINQFIAGSISSAVNGGFEHAMVRAFASADATGPAVAATLYKNISDISGPLLGQANDPTRNNSLDNVRMDPSIADNTYHTIGTGAQAERRYGRVELAWADQLVQSIALSHWATRETEEVNGMTLPTFNGPLTKNWTSMLASPITFTIPEPAHASLIAGLGALMMPALRRRRRA
jgi:hypothetical protein